MGLFATCQASISGAIMHTAEVRVIKVISLLSTHHCTYIHTMYVQAVYVQQKTTCQQRQNSHHNYLLIREYITLIIRIYDPHPTAVCRFLRPAYLQGYRRRAWRPHIHTSTFIELRRQLRCSNAPGECFLLRRNCNWCNHCSLALLLVLSLTHNQLSHIQCVYVHYI